MCLVGGYRQHRLRIAAERELRIIGRIALGSLRNKLLVLLPTALILNAFTPWAVTPLLMIGGAYLCYEGTEKVFETLFPNYAHASENATLNSETLEEEKVASAINTDFTYPLRLWPSRLLVS